MLFNSFVFLIIFLPATFALYYLFSRTSGGKFGIAFLVAASLVYYGWSKPEYIALIVLSAILNFVVAGHMHGGAPQKRRRAILVLGISVNLLVLAYFKYAGFMLQSINGLFATDLQFLQPLLPLAISFFTFQQIAFLVDRYKHIADEPSFSSYLLFVCFFPQLIAGPIVHHREMMPQFDRAKRNIDWQLNLGIGISIFALGLFKKVVIADSLAPFADTVFDAAALGHAPDFFAAWRACIAYTFQIYFDFSGYSDMAVGAARIFGIVLPLNFFSPYRATSIIEFWRRWHMTLSRFLRDYLYIPLGGNRHAAWRWAANIMVTMLLGGLWHGAGWNFVLWGGLHGVMLLVNHLWRKRTVAVAMLSANRQYTLFASHLLTLACIVVAWVFFRAESLDAASLMLSGLLGQNGFVVPDAMRDQLGWLAMLLSSGSLEFAPVSARQFASGYAVCLLAYAIIILLPNTTELMRAYGPVLPSGRIDSSREVRAKLPMEWQPSARWAIAIAAILFVALLMVSSEQEFIYYAF